MKHALLIVAISILAAGIVFAAVGEVLPRIEGVTLNDQKVVLPDPARYRVIVLVLGFSRKSAEQTQPWSKQLAADYSSQPGVAYFEVPVLQGVPGFVKPMILRGMRKDTPPAAQSHFLPIYQHRDELKKICGYKAEDDAYVLVAGADGRVLFHRSGRIDDGAYADVKRWVDQGLAAQPSGK